MEGAVQDVGGELESCAWAAITFGPLAWKVTPSHDRFPVARRINDLRSRAPPTSSVVIESRSKTQAT